MSAHRIDQQMAWAATKVLPSTIDRSLRTRMRQLPAMLRTSGLAATVAFVAAGAGRRPDGNEESTELQKAYTETVRVLVERLKERQFLPADVDPSDTRTVLHQLAGMDTVTYAKASAEARQLAIWLGRLADALCEPSKDEAGGAP